MSHCWYKHILNMCLHCYSDGPLSLQWRHLNAIETTKCFYSDDGNVAITMGKYRYSDIVWIFKQPMFHVFCVAIETNRGKCCYNDEIVGMIGVVFIMIAMHITQLLNILFITLVSCGCSWKINLIKSASGFGFSSVFKTHKTIQNITSNYHAIWYKSIMD